MTLSSVRGSTAIPDTDLFGIISGFDMMQFRGAANGAKTDGAQLGRMKRVSCQLGVDDVQLRAQPQQYTSILNHHDDPAWYFALTKNVGIYI